MPNSKPFVAAAFICERVLNEKDDVLSAIRIVDTYKYTVMEIPGPPNSGSEPSKIVKPIIMDAAKLLNLTALVMLKSGDVTGTHEVSVVGRSPDGKETPFPQKVPVVLNGGEHGANLIIRFVFSGENKPGLYWFDVLWNGEVLTSIPLKLVRESESQEPAKAH